MPHGELLARVGDVDPGEAVVARLGEQVADRLRRPSERVEVEELVAAAQAERLGLALVQGGAQRFLDPGADQPDTKRARWMAAVGAH